MADILRDRVFYLLRAWTTSSVPDLLQGDATGFGLVGKCRDEAKVSTLVGTTNHVALVDPAVYEGQIATVDVPVRPQGELSLFGEDGYYDETIERGALAVLTSSAYVEAGDVSALKAVRNAVRGIERTDVVAVMPLHVAWLRDPTIDQVIAIFQTIQHPIALSLGSQFNSTDAYVSVMPNLSRLYAACPSVGVWRVDLVTVNGANRPASWSPLGQLRVGSIARFTCTGRAASRVTMSLSIITAPRGKRFIWRRSYGDSECIGTGKPSGSDSSVSS